MTTFVVNNLVMRLVANYLGMNVAMYIATLFGLLKAIAIG